MIRKVLAFVRETLRVVRAGPATEYSTGYRHALEDVEEVILESMWEIGVDDNE